MSGVPTSIPGAGGRYSLSIGVSSSCQWTARTDVNWADVAPGSGQGNASPTLQVYRNETFFTRQFTVYINGHEQLLAGLKEVVNLAPGQTSPDGRFTLLPVCCLGNCDKGPAIMIDDDTYGGLDAVSLLKTLEAYP